MAAMSAGRLVRFTGAVAAALGIMLAAGGTGAAPSAEKTKVTFWHYFSEEQSKPLKELIAKFETANPDIQVQAYFQGFPLQLRQKLEASFASQPANNPTLSTVYENWTSAFHAKGLMEPVANYVGKPEGPKAADIDDIPTAFREANTWDGKMVTMPFAKSVYLMYVNKQRMEKAGLTTAPATQADFAAFAAKATERPAAGGRPKTYGVGIQPTCDTFTAFYLARGGDFFDPAGKAALAGEEGVGVLAMMRDLNKRDSPSAFVNIDYMSTPFGNQQIAAYVYSSASLPYNAKLSAGKFDVVTAPIPGDPEKGRSVMQGMNLGVFKNRPDAEKKAAMRLVTFLSEPANAVVWETRAGYMPIRKAVLAEPLMKAKMESDPAYGVAAGIVLADKGRQEPKAAEWDAIRIDLTAVVDRVMNQNADPKKELTALCAKIDAKMAKK